MCESIITLVNLSFIKEVRSAVQLYHSSSAHLLSLSVWWLYVYYVLHGISEAHKCDWKCSRINKKSATVIYDNFLLEGASYLETKSFMTFYAFEDSDGSFSFVCFLYVPWAEENQNVEILLCDKTNARVGAIDQ